MQGGEGWKTKIDGIWMSPGHVLEPWINFNVHTAVWKYRPPLNIELGKQEFPRPVPNRH